MTSFNDVRISTKVSLAFGLLTVCFIAFGIFAMNRLSAVHDTAVEIGTNWLPSVHTVDELKFAVTLHRVRAARHILTTDTSEIQHVDRDVAAAADLFQTMASRYEKLISEPEERTLYAELRAKWEPYLRRLDVALAHSRKNENDAATAGFRDTLAAFGEIEKILMRLVDVNMVGAERSEDAGEAIYATSRYLTISVGAFVVLLAVGAILAMRFGVAKPVVTMTDAMRRLAGGEMSTEVPARGRKDEIGAMAEAVQVFKDNMIEADRLRREQEESKARAEADKKAAMNKMADDFDKAVGGIVQSVSSAATELQSAAQSMTATAEETQRQSTAVAAASEQASSNVQTVASAAEELSGSISEIGRQVSESTRIAAQAVQDAARTNAQVQALAEAAQKIGDVVKLINDIAGQTNLLALNATIEAARAGEAGKGFAVVASEVKSLATQTGKATEDIANQVKAIQSATTDSVQAIQSIGQTIGRINEIATTIASAVEEQGAATKEISRNVQQASAGTSEVSSNISGVTQAATETGSAAAQVLSSSGELAQQGETLRTQVSRFLDTIRAA